MTLATIGKWDVGIDVTNGVTYVPLEEVTSFSGLGVTKATVEATNFDSPEGTKEFISGLAEGEEISIECNFIPDAAAQESLVTAADNGDTVAFEVSYDTPAKVWTFSAAMSGWGQPTSHSEINTSTFTAKITGPVTSVTAP